MGTSLVARYTKSLLSMLRQTGTLVRAQCGVEAIQSMGAPRLIVSLDAPSGVPNGLGQPVHPYIPHHVGPMSGHARMEAESHRRAAEDLQALLHAACAQAPGLAGWYGTLRFGVHADLTTSVWLGEMGADASPFLLCSREHPDDIVAHLDALLRAARYCAPLPAQEERRLWFWGGSRSQNADARPYPAVDVLDAGLMGLGLYRPNAVRTALLGRHTPIDVREYHPCHALHVDIAARRMAVDADASARPKRKASMASPDTTAVHAP